MSFPAGPTVVNGLTQDSSSDLATESFAAALELSFQKHASLPAVEGRHNALTFNDLDRESAVYATALIEAGVRAGDIVPLLARRSPEMIVAQVALIRIGAAYAPIDLASPTARQLAMLEQIKPRAVLVDRLSDAPPLENCRIVQLTDLETAQRGAGANWQHLPPHTLAYVMFTSGTTGLPKGVLIPQSGIKRLVCNASFANMQIGSRWAFASSPAFDASTLEVWAPLLNGGCVVVQEMENPTIDDLADFFANNSISDAWLTSALFSALVDDRPDAFRTLNQLLTGGERVSPQHARAVLQLYPDLHLINGYGPTENTTFTLCHPIRLADTENALGIPIGSPISGTVVRIGTEAHEPSEGELYAAGAGVALGYLGDAELTALKFVEIDGQTWYRTGDIVRRSVASTSGQQVFEFVGRADRQVKLQGHRVELDEVEREIAGHPAVSAAVVRLRGTTAESRHLIAYYTERSSEGRTHGIGQTSATDLHHWIRKRLPPQAIPAQLIAVSSLPVNANGKVDLKALDEMLDAGDSELDSFSGPRVTPGNVPRLDSASGISSHDPSDTATRLIELWTRLFPTASIYNQANFGALGGTSLTALQLSAQVRRQFGRDLSPIDVLRTPVLADQVRLIEATAPFDYESAPSANLESQLMLTQVQRTMLASAELDDSASAFLVHVALRLTGRVHPSALKRAFELLALRHPSLRLHVARVSEPSHGTIAAELPGEWWYEHSKLARVPDNLDWPDELLDRINRRFDLSRDGVMRVHYWPVADESALIVWTVHHVSIDEASIDRCLEELDLLLKGETLPPVYGSPASFAPFEKASIDRAAAHEWPQKLVAALGTVEPPLTRAPAVGSEFAVSLGTDTATALLKACERWRITPFAPLLVAYGEALQEVFGTQHRFVSTPFSRRAEEELIEPVGCLLDLRIVEAGLGKDESERAAIVRVSETAQKLQQPTFFPRTAVAEVLTRRHPGVAQQLNMFGFTWRLNPTRTVSLGSTRAELLRVQQRGARFGVTMHAWLDGESIRCSIESVRQAIDNGRSAAVAAAFVRNVERISQIAELRSSSVAARADSDAPLPQFSETTALQLRKAWSNRLSIDPLQVLPESHFLYQGGNSLAAMRLASALRREHGIAIDVGEFLARPTFESLCNLASGPRAHIPGCSVVLGAVNAPNVVVIFPGNLGNSLGSYRIADELVRRLGNNYAVAIVDLETMLTRAPQDQIVSFLGNRIEQLANEIGWNRIVAVAGLSSGGLLALNLLDRRRQNGEPVNIPVWLVDTYAPLGPVHAAIQKHVRPIVRSVIRHPLVAKVLNSSENAARKSEPPEVPGALAQLKHRVHKSLYEAWTWPRANDVHLVQALKTVRDVSLAWGRSSNGFRISRFARWHAHRLDGSHSELSRELAPATAELMANSLLDTSTSKK